MVGANAESLLIQINRGADRQFVAPDAEAPVVSSALRKSSGRNVEVVACGYVGALEVPPKRSTDEHIGVGEAGVHIERIQLNPVLDEGKGGTPTEVRSEQFIVRHHTCQNYVSRRGQTAGKGDIAAGVVFDRTSRVNPRHVSYIQTRRCLRSAF